VGELALLGYVLPGVIFIALLIINGRWRWLDSDALLNNLTIAHGLVLLGITLAMLFASQLPVYYLPERYFAFDRLAGYEIFIATVIFSLAAIYSRGYAKNLLSSGEIESGNTRLFYGAFNLLLTIVVLGFLANNIALFWIFLELSTLVSAILIVILKAHENIIAALKYVFIVSTAMLFAFVGIIILFAISRDVIPAGTFNWDSLLLIAPSLPVVPFSVAFIFILVGFGLKAVWCLFTPGFRLRIHGHLRWLACFYRVLLPTQGFMAY
jgi:hydrogenase-4 component F